MAQLCSGSHYLEWLAQSQAAFLCIEPPGCVLLGLSLIGARQLAEHTNEGVMDEKLLQ